MDRIDKKILSIINKSIPISERPFLAVAEAMGMSEEEVLDRIRKLKDSGLIRRIGATISPRAIGWNSTLCATDVPMDRIEEFDEFVGGYGEVTHNYLREGHPNCWFTLISPSSYRIGEIISEIEHALNIKILNLPARKVFKIKVALEIE
ncbi:MAG: AsnC family transcriptional regulator [Desulfomonilia bacterium]